MKEYFWPDRIVSRRAKVTPRWRLYATVAMVVALLLPVSPSYAQDATPSDDSPFSLFLPLVTGSTDTTAQADAPALKLKSGIYHPATGDLPIVAAGLTAVEAVPGQRGYYIVQFTAPIQEADKAALMATGVEVLDYLPDYAYKVRMAPGQAAQVRQLANVGWVGLFHPAYKLSPALVQNGLHAYRVRVETGGDSAAVTATLAAHGVEVLKEEGNYLLIAADSAQLVTVANVLDVAWIENFTLHEKHNEYGAGWILGANTSLANGYDGSSQIAAVADTGLGGGTPASAHAGLAGRVNAVYSWSTNNARLCYRVTKDGAQDADSGHGTHVAVSVVGDAVNGIGRSAAPAAHLVFQAVEEYLDIYGACSSPTTPDGYYLIGIPDDLRQLFQQAYNDGARVHANSWGSNAAGDYTLDSANADDFIWTHRDMVITFSAGNEGIDSNADGIIDNDSIGSPATAKNVITIGASENDRQGHYECDTGLNYQSHDAYQPNTTCQTMNGGQNILGTYGSRWPNDYPAGAISSDPTAGNAEQMAAFSSRGPTDDGRIKPDVVAPGTWVLSGYSDLYQESYDGAPNPVNGAYQLDGWGMPYNSQYKYFGGTSMSNPVAAGAAVVVRDFYQKVHTYNASAALTKATLINSAVDLLDENNDGSDDNAFPIPNVHEGWGRIDLVNATDNSQRFFDESTGVTTGTTMNYQHTVATAGKSLKITLVWSDFASTETAATNLVNNLNLVVTAPNNTVYRGNVFSGGWSQTGGSADNVNNVENVFIANAAVGTWSVAVSGANVPQGPQPFALVIDDGVATPVDFPPTVSINSPSNGATVFGPLNITASANDVEGVAGVEFFVNGSSLGVDGTAPYAASWDTTTVADGSYTISVKATDTIGQIATASVDVTVANNAPTTIHVGDLDGSITSGSRNRWNATVTITVHDETEGPVAGATVSGGWSNGGSGSGTCVTDGSGQCSIPKSNLRNSSVTFTVSSVSDGIHTYNAGANHDPDGDSNGTVIVVNP